MDCGDQGYEENRFHCEIHESLKCLICQNILKQPVQCCNNEHYYCFKCIAIHLQVNTKKCPVCQDDLTEETLKRPSRVVSNMLEDLQISCDNAAGGCEEILQLGTLEAHLTKCPFSPSRCSNQGCAAILNKQDVARHERHECDFRSLACEDCQCKMLAKHYEGHLCLLKLKRENDVLRDQMKELATKTEERFSTQEELLKKLSNAMAELKHIGKPRNCLPRADFLVAGGYNGTAWLNAVEKYSSSHGKWIPLPPMTQARSSPSSFVYNNEIFICGGSDGLDKTDTIEKIKILGNVVRQWSKMDVKLPYKCNGQTSNIREDNLVICGGYNANKGKRSNTIYEVLLNRPYEFGAYASRLVCCMFEERCDHGAEVINGNLVIVGGRATKYAKDSVDTVLSCDVRKKEVKIIGQLPYPVSGMATVRHGDSVIVIGGQDVHGKVLDKVLMFNTGTGESRMLPDLNVGRVGCTAIISRDVVVVMGGMNSDYVVLKSVECINIELSRRWEELPVMSTPRTWATAVVIPV